MIHIDIRTAATLMPNRLTTATILRRITHGVRGHKLKAEFDGYRWLTSREWIQEHLDDLNGRNSQPVHHYGRQSTKKAKEIFWSL